MIRALALLLLVIFIPVGLLAITAQDTTIYGIVITDGAEVRVGPDFAYDSIGQLPANASVTVLGRAGDFYSSWDGREWLQIQYGSSPAWIYARLVRTSVAFNSIFPTGRLLPRDKNGRVPDGFDLSSEVCSQWQGGYTLSGDFMAVDRSLGASDPNSPDVYTAALLQANPSLTVTYPGLTGTSVYGVIVISPTGDRREFDSNTTTAQIPLDQLPAELGTYTWRVAPFWTDSFSRYNWQQICLLHTGGTFQKPYTGFYPMTPTPSPYPTLFPTATPWSAS